MENLNAIEVRCIEQLEMDYTPLHDIVREFSGYDKLQPSTAEFLKAMEFLEYLIKKYNLKIYEQSGGEETKKSSDEILSLLRRKWHANKYDDINYGIWFTK